MHAVNTQPMAVDSIFSLSPQERVLNVYEFDATCCGCGSQYTTTLTDSRVLQRRKCRQCCCTCGHSDYMLFLSDISQITDTREYKCCDCICCYCCCCLDYIYCCCCPLPYYIYLRGPFGSEAVAVAPRLANQALVEIPIAARIHKITAQPALSAMPMPPNPSPPYFNAPAHNDRFGDDDF
jgi:hypothetical protein